MYNDLLLISTNKKTASKIQQLLYLNGISATVTSPCFINKSDFEHFSHLLSTHRFVAKLEEPTSIALIMDNLRCQNSILQAENLQLTTPDLWVQFGSNTSLMQESQLDAESIVKRILQELFANDYRPFSKREQKAFV